MLKKVISVFAAFVLACASIPASAVSLPAANSADSSGSTDVADSDATSKAGVQKDLNNLGVAPEKDTWADAGTGATVEWCWTDSADQQSKVIKFRPKAGNNNIGTIGTGFTMKDAMTEMYAMGVSEIAVENATDATGDNITATINLPADSKSMFAANMGKLTNVSALSHFNANNCTNFSGMFESQENITTFSGALDNWQPSAAADYTSMFDGCGKLTTTAGMSNLLKYALPDGSEATSKIDKMFLNCSKITDYTALASWDTSSVCSMSRVFDGCSGSDGNDGRMGFSTVKDLVGWNTSHVTNMSGMFTDTLITTLGTLADPDAGITASGLANWNTSNVTDMSEMFNQCGNLKDITAVTNWSVGKVTTMADMFNECQLKSLDALSKWRPNALKFADQMFSGDSSGMDDEDDTYGKNQFTNVNGLSGWWATTKLNSASGMFGMCVKLTDITGLKGMEFVKTQNPEDDTQILDANIMSMFSGCVKLVNIDALATWKGLSNINDISAMFLYDRNLKHLNALADWSSQGGFDGMACAMTFADLEGVQDFSALSKLTFGKVVQSDDVDIEDVYTSVLNANVKMKSFGVPSKLCADSCTDDQKALALKSFMRGVFTGNDEDTEDATPDNYPFMPYVGDYPTNPDPDDEVVTYNNKWVEFKGVLAGEDTTTEYTEYTRDEAKANDPGNLLTHGALGKVYCLEGSSANYTFSKTGSGTVNVNDTVVNDANAILHFLSGSRNTIKLTPGAGAHIASVKLAGTEIKNQVAMDGTLLLDVDDNTAKTLSVTFEGGADPDAGKINITGDATINFAKDASFVCTGLPLKPKFSVTYLGDDGLVTLSEGTDYTVSYANNVEPGTATVTVTARGRYKGVVTGNFTITGDAPEPVTPGSPITPETPNPYNEQQTETITEEVGQVVEGEKTLDETSQDTQDFVNDVVLPYEQGTTSADQLPDWAKDILDNSGVTDVEPEPEPEPEPGPGPSQKTDISNSATVSFSAGTESFTCTGLPLKPVVSVAYTDADGVSHALVNGRDYSVSYANNVNPGTATVTVTGKGNYSGTVTSHFTITGEAPAPIQPSKPVTPDEPDPYTPEDKQSIVDELSGVVSGESILDDTSEDTQKFVNDYVLPYQQGTIEQEQIPEWAQEIMKEAGIIDSIVTPAPDSDSVQPENGGNGNVIPTTGDNTLLAIFLSWFGL